jgi:hypothetical protein
MGTLRNGDTETCRHGDMDGHIKLKTKNGSQGDFP